MVCSSSDRPSAGSQSPSATVKAVWPGRPQDLKPRRIRQILQDALNTLYDNLLLFQLIKGGLAAQTGGNRNRTTEGELADGFALQQRSGSKARLGR